MCHMTLIRISGLGRDVDQGRAALRYQTGRVMKAIDGCEALGGNANSLEKYPLELPAALVERSGDLVDIDGAAGRLDQTDDVVNAGARR